MYSISGSQTLEFGPSVPQVLEFTQFLTRPSDPSPQIIVLRPWVWPSGPHRQNHRITEPQILDLKSSGPQPQNLRPPTSPTILSLISLSSDPHNLEPLTFDVYLISGPQVNVSITLIVTHPQIIDLTYSLSYSTVYNIRLGYRLFSEIQ